MNTCKGPPFHDFPLIYFMQNSVCYRGGVLWNCVLEYFNDSCNCKQFYSKAKSSLIFMEIRFPIK